MHLALRIADANDDDLVIDHYLAVWESYGVPEGHFLASARERVGAFIASSRDANEGGVVLGITEERIVGSVGYERQAPQFPEVLRPEIRKIGYIWSVYVEPQMRGRGFATRMVEEAVARLRAIGCTMIAPPCVGGRSAGLFEARIRARSRDAAQAFIAVVRPLAAIVLARSPLGRQIAGGAASTSAELPGHL